MKRKAEEEAVDTPTPKKIKPSDHVASLKPTWIALTKKDVSEDKKKALTKTLFDGLLPHLPAVCFSGTGARIASAVVKHADEDMMKALWGGIEGEWLRLAKDKYARHVISQILKKDKAWYEVIYNTMVHKVPKLIRHAQACVLLDQLYEAGERSHRSGLANAFYGKFDRLKDLHSDLVNAFEAAELQTVRVLIESVVAKNLLRHRIVHHAVFQFLEKDPCEFMKELLDDLCENFVVLLTSDYGCKIAFIVVTLASAKNRKTIAKEVSKVIPEMAMDPGAIRVLIRLLDVTDDTVLLTKTILRPLFKDNLLESLAVHRVGHRVPMFLLRPYDPSFFSKDLLAQLEAPFLENGTAKVLSKKDAEVRQNELRSAFLKLFLEHLATPGRATPFLGNKFSVSLLVATFVEALKLDMDVAAAFRLFAESVCIADEKSPLREAFVNRAIKVAIKEHSRFADLWIEEMDLPYWCGEPYANFVVLALLECPSTKAKAKKTLKGEKKRIRSIDNPGAKEIAALL